MFTAFDDTLSPKYPPSSADVAKYCINGSVCGDKYNTPIHAVNIVISNRDGHGTVELLLDRHCVEGVEALLNSLLARSTIFGIGATMWRGELSVSQIVK